MSLGSPHRTTGELITASIWNTDLVDAINSLGVSTDGTTWTGAVQGVSTKTALIGASLFGHTFNATLLKAGSGVQPSFTGLFAGTPIIGGGGATVAFAASLTVADAPTGAVVNYALLVTGDGLSEIQGNLQLRTDLNHGLSFDDSRITGVSSSTVKAYVGPLSGQFVLNTTTSIPLALGFNNATVLTIGDGVTLPMTTIEMGTAALETIALSSTGSVAQGFTTDAHTSWFGTLRKAGATAGGLSIAGYTSATIGLHLNGNGTAGDLTKATSSTASIVLTASGKGLGTTAIPWATNYNLLAVRNNTTAVFIVNADGDTFYHGAAAAHYDEFDDVALARSLDLAFRGPGFVDSAFDQFVRYNRSDLERAGIVTEGDMICSSRLARLHNGAIWQLHQRLEFLTQRLAALEGA